MANNYSQTDPQWANLAIGETSILMKTDGCLVTALASVSGYTPAEVLEKIDFDGAQVSWKGLENIGLELVYKEKSSDLGKIKDYINQFGFCIVRVDYDGSTKTNSDTHFVVYLPGDVLMDPLDGFIKPISTYPVITGIRAVKKLGTATVPVRQEATIMMDPYSGLDLANMEAMRVAAKTWKDVVTGRYVKKDDYDAQWGEKLDALTESFNKDIDNIHLKYKNEELEKSKRHDNDVLELKAQIQGLQSQIANNGNSLKNRLTSRKFLMTLSSTLVVVAISLLDVFGVHVDPEKLNTAVAGIIALTLMFVGPEALTDYKTRELNIVGK